MRTLIQSTSNLNDSLEFYSKLKFKVISDEDPVIVSNGKAFIQINPTRYARAGIRLFRPTWQQTISELESWATVLETNEGYLLSDPSGMWIYLDETSNHSDLQVADSSSSALGSYMGIGLETTEIKRSKQLWTILGFRRTDPTWPSFTNDDQVTVTLYEPNSCPHLFFNPSLTYFNGSDNLKVIEYIRKQQIPVTEEITYFIIRIIR